MSLYISGYGLDDLEERLRPALQDESVLHLEVEGVTFSQLTCDLLQNILQRRPAESVTLRNCTGPLVERWGQTKTLSLHLMQLNFSSISLGSNLKELSLFSVILSEAVSTLLGEQLGYHKSIKTLDLTESRFLDGGAVVLAQGTNP